MITRPFDFGSMVKRPEARLEAVPLIDVFLIAVFFSVLSSRFVLAPGIALSLPTTVAAPVDAVPAAHVLTVMETQGAEVLIYETGGILTLESFARVLDERRKEIAGQVLLIRADRDVSLQVLTRVWEIALEAGFAQVMIGAEPEKTSTDGF